MSVITRRAGDVTILDVTGRLVRDTSHELREAFRAALNHGARKLLLNLAQVTAMDEDGMGELVSSHNTAGHLGAKLRFCNLPGKVYELLAITKLITVFETFESEADALASFAS
jgi:anti-sigma B factor antagonist